MNRFALLLPLMLLGLIAATPAIAAKAPSDSDVLVTVNGVQVKRKQVMERSWARASNAALNEIVDDVLLEQAAKSSGVKADPAVVDARMKRVQAQFKDENDFKSRLTAQGLTIERVRSQIEQETLREALVTKARDIKVTDAEVKTFFDTNKDRLGTPEAVKLRHILVANEKEANDFLTAVKVGANFATLAAQVSLDKTTKDKGGDLGFIPKGMLQPEIEKIAWTIKPGDVGGPVKTAQGFHILKVEEIRPASPAVFEKIAGEIKEAILADKITKAWNPYLQELHEKAKIVANPGKA